MSVALGFVLTCALPLAAQDLSVPSRALVREGAIAGEGPGHHLTEVLHARFAPDGNIVIHYRTELSILEFDAAGALVRRIGREGGGPGEFLGINRLGFLGDTLWVEDYRQRRVTWLVAGELARVETASSEGDALPYLPSTFLDDGAIVLASPVAGRLVVELAARDGTARSDLADLPTAPAVRRVPMGDRTLRALDPFADHAIAAPAADGSGIAFVGRPRATDPDPAAFTVVRYYRGTRTAREIRYTPKPLQAYERARVERYIDAYDRQIGRVAGWPRQRIADAFHEGLGEPRYALPVYHALMGTTGDVWLAVDDAGDGMLWVVLDDGLEESATVLVPAGERLVAVAGDRLATVKKDALDVPSITLYRVRTR